jgi:hypothetical protein
MCSTCDLQTVLDDLGSCLLSHSVHVPEHLSDNTEVPDPGTLLDLYGNRGLDFIVDVGPRVAVASTVGLSDGEGGAAG